MMWDNALQMPGQCQISLLLDAEGCMLLCFLRGPGWVLIWASTASCGLWLSSIPQFLPAQNSYKAGFSRTSWAWDLVRHCSNSRMTKQIWDVAKGRALSVGTGHRARNLAWPQEIALTSACGCCHLLPLTYPGVPLSIGFAPLGCPAFHLTALVSFCPFSLVVQADMRFPSAAKPHPSYLTGSRLSSWADVYLKMPPVCCHTVQAACTPHPFEEGRSPNKCSAMSPPKLVPCLLFLHLLSAPATALYVLPHIKSHCFPSVVIYAELSESRERPLLPMQCL